MLNEQKIAHLYARAGFGISPQQWQTRRHWSLERAIQELFQEGKRTRFEPLAEHVLPDVDVMKISKEEKKKRRKEESKLIGFQSVAWLQRMAADRENALLERMTLFWHDHFACQISRSKFANMQLNTLRKHALGNFRDLVHAITKDPAMLIFLNNHQNKKRSANENFARELMELFTIGHGNYTEDDVTEAARAFTGWSVQSGDYFFRERQHDYGRKTFLGKTANFDGKDIVEMLLAKRETAYYIVRKMYRYFVNEEKDNSRIINQLATVFYDSNYDIKTVLRAIFTSNWFYAPENIGNKIKSPTDLLVGLTQHINLQFEDRLMTIKLQRRLGQVFFLPPNVAGWAGGKNWIDNSTLMLRLNLVNSLLKTTKLSPQKRKQNAANLLAKLDVGPLLQLVEKVPKKAIYDELVAYLFASPLQVKRTVVEANISRSNRAIYVQELAVRLMSLPEYQVC